jgi:4-hydroxybenzoate polyprenyltransferase
MLYGVSSELYWQRKFDGDIDTIYACQDVKDDVKMGVRSTAILFGTWIRPLLVACGLAFVWALAGAGALNGQGAPFFVVSVGGTAVHLVWQFLTVDLALPRSCWSESSYSASVPTPDIQLIGNFNRNGQLGWIVWVGLALDYLLMLHMRPELILA